MMWFIRYVLKVFQWFQDKTFTLLNPVQGHIMCHTVKISNSGLFIDITDFVIESNKHILNQILGIIIHLYKT